MSKRSHAAERSGFTKVLSVSFGVLGGAVAILVIAVLAHRALEFSRQNKETAGTRPALPTEAAQGDITGTPPGLAAAQSNVIHRLSALNEAQAQHKAALSYRDNLRQQYKGRTMDRATEATVARQYDAADEAVVKAKQAMESASEAFHSAYAVSRNLGSTNHYQTAAQ
jgi:hypothetical protein